MRYYTLTLALTLAATFSLASTSLAANGPNGPDASTNWNQFSQALSHAVQHDNAGVQMGALQQIARYGEQLNLSNEAIFEIVRVYRSANSDNERILALMALDATNDVWAMDFVTRSARFENSARVLKHTQAVIQAHK